MFSGLREAEANAEEGYHLPAEQSQTLLDPSEPHRNKGRSFVRWVLPVLASVVVLVACARRSGARAVSTSGVIAADEAPPWSGSGAAQPSRVPYDEWSGLIKSGDCSAQGRIPCSMERGLRTFRFPPGIFEMDAQLLVPERTAIIGAQNPNDMNDPTRSPDWAQQTLFLATRGATDYKMNYCFAPDMVSTRVGFVLSSYVTVSKVSFQGVDTIRPQDNGALCGGGAFETKGCARNDCGSGVNNAGSDGMASVNVLIENVRLNDYYFAADKAKVGANIPGNQCGNGGCCMCQPNGIRSSQVGVWVPQTRNPEGTSNLTVWNVVSSSTQADGVNLHGKVVSALVQNAYFQNTGDDVYALWGANLVPTSVVFRSCVAVNPGVLRPNWYGNCVATYGFGSVVFEDITCKAPTGGHGPQNMNAAMFVFYGSFGAKHPPWNRADIKGWSFQDMQGNGYQKSSGVVGNPVPWKMTWNQAKSGVFAPYYINGASQPINVYATPR